MSGYLEAYGAGDERRNRFIKGIVIAVIALIVLSITGYLLFENLPEKQTVRHFLSEVNSGQYQAAYQTWGCTQAHPCNGYDYNKFLEDWGPKQSREHWAISDVDGCPTGVVVTVSAHGAEPQPLWVQRSDKSISFSPWPECQGKRWRFRQFFHRVFGG